MATIKSDQPTAAPQQAAQPPKPAPISREEYEALDLEFKREQLAALRRQRLKEELQEAKEEELRQAARRQKLALGENVAKEQAALAKQQERCTHKQKRGETCVGGQTMPSGREYYICQSCRYVWRSFSDIPPHLRPANQIGSVRRVASQSEQPFSGAPPANPETAPTIAPLATADPAELALAALRGEI